jgi:hypothetical protein
MTVWAFMKDHGDKGWCVCIVEDRGNGTGELVDARVFPDEASADAWRIEKIGDGETVYRAPELKAAMT